MLGCVVCWAQNNLYNGASTPNAEPDSAGTNTLDPRAGMVSAAAMPLPDQSSSWVQGADRTENPKALCPLTYAGVFAPHPSPVTGYTSVDGYSLSLVKAGSAVQVWCSDHITALLAVWILTPNAGPPPPAFGRWAAHDGSFTPDDMLQIGRTKAIQIRVGLQDEAGVAMVTNADVAAAIDRRAATLLGFASMQAYTDSLNNGAFGPIGYNSGIEALVSDPRLQYNTVAADEPLARPDFLGAWGRELTWVP